MKRYMRAEVWSFLRRHPGSNVGAVAVALRHPKRATSTLLVSMRAHGIIRTEGKTHSAVWFICGPKPECGWGLSANSIAQLQKTPLERAALLRKAYIAKGIDPDNVKPRKRGKARQYYTGALEECWLGSRAPQGD